MANMFHLEQLSPLYEAVQRSGIFPDSKYFPDCILRAAPKEIVAAYEQERGRPDFDLKTFVETWFKAPPEPETGYASGNKSIDQHLDNLWDTLRREADADTGMSTLIPLPHPYIVPGGRFREVYYWDSYFTLLGLKAAGKHDLIRHIADNFAYLIDTFGHIPNGNRSYYLSRSQPPFFALIVQLLSEVDGEEVPMRYRVQLEKEYAFWMAGENELTAENSQHRRVVLLPDGSVLNRYWDDLDSPRPEAFVEDEHLAAQSGRVPESVYRHIRAAAESGWDFSSRWFADGQDMASIHTTELLPIDLNCLLYFLEKTLLNLYRRLPDRVPADVMKEKARRRKHAIQQYAWDESAGFYFDYDFIQAKVSDHWTLAAVYPLFFQIATEAQAARVAAHLEAKFEQDGGLVTTLAQTGQQWDAPNGWAPLQWMAWKGLQNYGHHELADRLRTSWRSLNEKTYAETGKMMEKYNVMDTKLKAGGGEYPNQDGFGWTNGVYGALAGPGTSVS